MSQTRWSKSLSGTNPLGMRKPQARQDWWMSFGTPVKGVLVKVSRPAQRPLCGQSYLRPADAHGKEIPQTLCT